MGVQRLHVRASARRRGRITKKVMDSAARVRNSNDGAVNVTVRPMTTRDEGRGFGVLETLSPELARDLCDAFSLARIGSGPRKNRGESTTAVRRALRLAGRITAFLLVAAIAVSLTIAAMFLIPLP